MVTGTQGCEHYTATTQRGVKPVIASLLPNPLCQHATLRKN